MAYKIAGKPELVLLLAAAEIKNGFKERQCLLSCKTEKISRKHVFIKRNISLFE